MAKSAVVLEDRGVLAVEGPDRVQFLQGIVSNDVTQVTPDRALWTAFLTPQGKYLHDFFIAQQGETFLLDCEADRLPDLMKRLTLYKLRTKVTLADAGARFKVAALFGEGVAEALDLPPEEGAARPFGGGVIFVDPRLAAAGARAILPRQEALPFPQQGAVAYHRHRIALGLPDGSRDIAVERGILLENGFDELHGVDWKKGCYMGQELTARTRYRGLVRKRLMPVTVEGPLPPPGTAVEVEGKEAGEIRGGVEGLALALIRLEWLDKPDVRFRAGEAIISPKKPDWAVFGPTQA